MCQVLRNSRNARTTPYKGWKFMVLFSHFPNYTLDSCGTQQRQLGNSISRAFTGHFPASLAILQQQLTTRQQSLSKWREIFPFGKYSSTRKKNPPLFRRFGEAFSSLKSNLIFMFKMEIKVSSFAWAKFQGLTVLRKTFRAFIWRGPIV